MTTSYCDILMAHAAELGVSVSPEQCEKLQRHWRLVQRWNQHLNLTAVKTDEEAIALHYIDSLAPLARLTLSGPLLDVGAGAGFPGLVLAALCPDQDFHLMEAQRKRASFMHQAAAALSLSNVRVWNTRFDPSRPDILPPARTFLSRATFPPQELYALLAHVPIERLLLYTVHPTDHHPLPPFLKQRDCWSFSLPAVAHPRTIVLLERLAVP